MYSAPSVSDRFLRHAALETPGVHRLEQRLRARRWIPGSRKQLRDSTPLRFRTGRLRRRACDRPHTALVRYRRTLAHDFHGQGQHHFAAEAEPLQVCTAETANLLRAGEKELYRALDVDHGQVRREGRRIRLLRPNAAIGTQRRGRRMRVRARQRFVGEPAVGDEPARAGRVHDVAAPNRVDADQCVGNCRVES